MHTVHRGDVDGVACFWVDSGRPTLNARLTFRHGFADEALPASGWTHLLEHLALHGRGGGRLAVNGQVSTMHTSFDAHGPAELVAEHLHAVASFLREPRLDDLAHEREVLAAEAALRGGPVVRAFGQRYGARGPGVCAYGEPGLSRATPERLRDLAATAFGAANAVLVLDGPPPAGLRLDLSEGSRRPAPDATPCDVVHPEGYTDEDGLVLSGLVRRSTPATLLPDVLQRALFDDLRVEAAGAYAPWSTYERVDSGHAVVLAGSDLSPTLLPSVVDRTFAMLDRLATEVPHGHVRDAVESRVQQMTDPYAAVGLAWSAASRHLDDEPVGSPQDWLDEVRAVGPHDLQSAVGELVEQLSVAHPRAAGAHPRLHYPGQPLTEPVRAGRRHRHRNWPAVRDTMGTDGTVLHLNAPDGGPAVVVDAAAAEVVVRGEHGALTVVDPDGWSTTVDPREWRRGQVLSDVVIATADPERLVDSLRPDDAWRRASFGARWRHGTRPLLRGRRAVQTYVVAFPSVIVAGVATDVLPGVTMIGALGFVWSVVLTRHHERRAQKKAGRAAEQAAA